MLSSGLRHSCAYLAGLLCNASLQVTKNVVQEVVCVLLFIAYATPKQKMFLRADGAEQAIASSIFQMHRCFMST